MLMLPCSNDIVGMAIWGTSNADWTAKHSKNLNIYLSTTPAHRNGSLCISDYSPLPYSSAGPLVPGAYNNNPPPSNNVTCAAMLNNTRYVTIERAVTWQAQQLGLSEVQVLRSGEDRIPKQPPNTKPEVQASPQWLEGQ